jgi:GDP-mannose 6-dehydrogenase
MRISIFGMGYVGCVSGTCLAGLGHKVIGVEPNQLKVDLINAGRSPIVEKGLDELLAAQVKAGQLKATANWEDAVQSSDLAFVCVGTPSRANGSINIGFLQRVCEQIGQALRKKEGRFTVVIRSTVIPGTVEKILIPILEQQSGKKAGPDFGVCMNPEFLREGTSVEDFHHPPNTVIGELDSRSGDALVELYRTIPGPVFRTTLRVAEMVKYANNAFHALKVSFANEIGNFCKELSIDSHTVMEIFCQDRKLNLSPYYLKPGFAFGGSCLPKDLRAITYEARTLDVETPVLSSILESNRAQILRVMRKLTEYKGRSLGFLGLSFKGGTDDLRESPIVELIELLIGKGFAIRIYDRHVSLARLMGANKEYIEREIPHISRLMCSSAEELIGGSDVIVVGNRDDEFTRLLNPLPARKTVVDLVRVCCPASPNQDQYYGICW